MIRLVLLSTKHYNVVLAIIALLYLPLYESWYRVTLWGLNWQSPLLMHLFGHYLLCIKFIFVSIGLFVLYKNKAVISEALINPIARSMFLLFNYALGTLQLCLLFWGVVFGVTLSSDLEYIHKEQSFTDSTIYVYTADPGAFGQAYHYFNLKCPLPYNRYKLILIGKTKWMRDFTMVVVQQELVINAVEPPNKEIDHRFDLCKLNCHD